MNYIHHAIIGVGTASLGVIAAQTLGTPQIAPLALGVGALVTAAGSIATDLDHPKSFISNTIPSRVIRVALAILAIPIFVALGVLLTTRDVQGTWTKFSSLLFEVSLLRWTVFALSLSLGLMLLSWLLYKSLHHRGPLHSLVFAMAVTIAACVTFAVFKLSWSLGLLFGWGWLWHILADGLTVEGVPFWWPIHDQRVHVLPGWALGVGRVLLSLSAIGGILGLIYLQVVPYFK
jgi:membrane-bound metal-dependent hydrolase YbcI (DUF457 family)